MKKTKGKETLKVVVASALAIGVFSAALIGANHLAFAAATNGTQVIPAAVTEVPASAPQNLPPNGFQTPDLTVIGSPALGQHANNTASASAMSMEEAAQIGAQYIWDVFGESIDGMYVEMLFSSVPSHSRALWIGIVFPDNPASMEANDLQSRAHRAHNELYRFAIDAVTGLRVDISPGFGYVPQPSYEERQALNETLSVTMRISDEQMAWHIAWEAMTTAERMTYLGLSQSDIEPYLQAGREFARSHFNNSTVVYTTESFNVLHNIIDRFATDTAGFGGIIFSVSDDTGREAEIWINAGTRCLRPGLGIRTEHNDFIPGFSYDRPGGVG